MHPIGRRETFLMPGIHYLLILLFIHYTIYLHFINKFYYILLPSTLLLCFSLYWFYFYVRWTISDKRKWNDFLFSILCSLVTRRSSGKLFKPFYSFVMLVRWIYMIAPLKLIKLLLKEMTSLLSLFTVSNLLKVFLINAIQWFKKGLIWLVLIYRYIQIYDLMRFR